MSDNLPNKSLYKSEKDKVVVIGSGLSGMIAAAMMAKNGYNVDVLEKNSQPGGRIRTMHKDGFTFDMGPSWYWMPDVIEDHFQLFGHTASDYFDLVRLDPSYSVYWSDEAPLRVPADFRQLSGWMEGREPGSSQKLDLFLEQAEVKYRTGMCKLAQKPMQQVSDYLDLDLIRKARHLDLFRSMHSHLHRYFGDSKILSLLGFPILFLGGTTKQIPALYSLMNYADMKLGTWYPMGGMFKLSEAWHQIALEQGVHFHFNEEVQNIQVTNSRVEAVETQKAAYPADACIGTGDYNHIEQHLLPLAYREYTPSYWGKRTMAPSCLLYFAGIDRKVPGLTHHNLFFDEDIERHHSSIYINPDWPETPLFYICCPSKTDPDVAPHGCENLFILIPVAPGLEEPPEIHEYYFQLVLKRLEKHVKLDLKPHILFRESFGIEDFKDAYHSFRGNAYGLANTLKQTAAFKPSMKHKKIKNMVYAGQLTAPGPGIPPVLMSGRMAAEMLLKINLEHENNRAEQTDL